MNLEEARNVAKWLTEDVSYIATTRDIPVEPFVVPEEALPALILELADEVERLEKIKEAVEWHLQLAPTKKARDLPLMCAVDDYNASKEER